MQLVLKLTFTTFVCNNIKTGIKILQLKELCKRVLYVSSVFDLIEI